MTKAEKNPINLYERLHCGSFNVYQYTNERLNVDFFHVLNFRINSYTSEKNMNEFLFAPFIKSINMMNLGTDQVVKYLHKYVSIY